MPASLQQPASTHRASDRIRDMGVMRSVRWTNEGYHDPGCAWILDDPPSQLFENEDRMEGGKNAPQQQRRGSSLSIHHPVLLQPHKQQFILHLLCR